METYRSKAMGWMLYAGMILGGAVADVAAAPAYTFETWSQPGNCDRYRALDYNVRGPRAEKPLADMSDRVVSIVVSLGSSDEDIEALRLAQLCRALDLTFRSVMLPPPRPEPWNPNPAYPQGRAFVAHNGMRSEKIGQSISLQYYEKFLSLYYWISREVEVEPTQALFDDVSYADIGEHCPLRAQQLKDRLVAAGYSIALFDEAPPDKDLLLIDQGPFYLFTRGNRTIYVKMQGTYTDQRRALDSHCVGSIDLKIHLD